MFLLILFVSLALGVSFLCSVLEAVLLSVTPSFIARAVKDDPQLGARLQALMADIARPLAAILTLNTTAHTVGAVAIGTQATRVFGNQYVGVFSAVLTLLFLVVAEIIPKTFGATYWRQLAPRVARMVDLAVRLVVPLSGLTWPLNKIVRALGWLVPRGDAESAVGGPDGDPADRGRSARPREAASSD